MGRKLMMIMLALLIPAWVAVGVAFAAPTLVWDASSGTVTGYRIYYGLSSGSYTNSKDVGDVTQYSISSLPLQDSTTYYFVARAYNGAGESGNSNEVSYKTPDTTAPLPPQGVTVQ